MDSSRGCARDGWRPLTRREAGASDVVSKRPKAGGRAWWKACQKTLDACSDLRRAKRFRGVLTVGDGAGSVAREEGARRTRQ